MKQYVLERLLKSKQNSDVVKVVNIVEEPGLKKGENYMSIISRYAVTVLLNSGETRVIHVIVKSFPKEKQHCVFLKEVAFFKTEIENSLDNLLIDKHSVAHYLKQYSTRVQQTSYKVSLDSNMQQEFIERLLKSKENSDVVKVVNIDEEPGLNKGENYMSIISRYAVTVLLNSGEKRVVRVIVKSLPKEKQHCVFLDEVAFFKNEIEAYSKVLCKMKALMEEFSDKRDTLWCEMFGYVPYNQIILQDLKELQFYPMDRRKNLDYVHSKYLIQSLARFHAMAAILLKRNSVSVDDFEPYTFAKKKVVKLFFWSYLQTMAKAMETNWGNEWKAVAKKLRDVAEKVYPKLQELSKIDFNRFNVINHGDTWTNNFLFKHVDGTDLPCGLKFLDYQISHYNSFAWDLTYFFYTSILPEIRRAKYFDLITFYHQELSENLKYFKYPNEKIPTLNHVMEEMNRIRFYGFLLLTSIYPWTTAETDAPYDVEKALTNNENPETAVNIEIFICSKYRKMVENDLKDFVKEAII